MDKSFSNLDQRISKYVVELCQPEDRFLREIRERAKTAGLPPIHVGPMDGRHLEVLTRMSGAKKVVEIGTLAGYSGICIARGLPHDGHLYTFEFSVRNAKVAQETFELAGFKDKVTLVLGAAIETLKTIEKNGPFDLVFIDADKVSYIDYMKWADKNLRVGGTIIADNTFAWGMVVEPPNPDSEDHLAAKAILKFNQAMVIDENFKVTFLPTGEGLTLATKIK